ncbi:hypothetical protein D3C72_838390 [compost metagenome]
MSTCKTAKPTPKSTARAYPWLIVVATPARPKDASSARRPTITTGALPQRAAAKPVGIEARMPVTPVTARSPTASRVAACPATDPTSATFAISCTMKSTTKILAAWIANHQAA